MSRPTSPGPSLWLRTKGSSQGSSHINRLNFILSKAERIYSESLGVVSSERLDLSASVEMTIGSGRVEAAHTLIKLHRTAA